MATIEYIITDNIDVWSSAIKQRNTQGRGRDSGKKQELYGIQKLRELILELAVRGLLVPQDSNDEPASKLLERIAVEKELLIKSKRIKKTKDSLPINEDEEYYTLPKSWSWIRLADIGHDWGQKTPDKTFTYIDVGAINKELGFVENPNELEASAAPSRARKIVKYGTVIYSTVRPYLLNIAVIDRHFEPEAIASTAFAIIHPFSGVDANYIYRYLRSPSFIKYVESCQTGIAYPAVNDKQFFYGLIPIPPVEEQKRIVAKVDELMALCDQLEQQQENSIEAHQQLVEILLTALTQAADSNSFDAAWSRIAENFDTLFTTENSIDQLKQTLLQLAVMGKLVPQDPNDEPASVLLEKIATEKERLINEGKIKKQKSLPAICEDEVLFDLPASWKWSKVGDVSLLKGGFAYKSKEFVSSSKYQLIRMGNIRPNFLRLNENPVFITEDIAGETGEYQLLENDILLTMTGTKGKRDYLYSLKISAEHLIGKQLYLNQRLCILRGLIVNSDYLNLIIKENRLLDAVYAKSTGTANQANIGMEAILNWVIPIPPLKEQLFIVKKLDQLFIICDQLKAKINTAQKIQLDLADAITEQAIQ